MDGATIQAKVYNGYAMAAARVGTAYAQFRPTGAANPTAAGNQIATIQAAFDATAYKFTTPNLFGKPVWYGLFDGRVALAGDYFIGLYGTYYVAGLEPLLPIVCVSCNRTITVARPFSPSGIGAQPYGGDIRSQAVAVMTAWPASVLQGTKGEKGDAQLPGDTRMPWMQILLPAWAGTDILTNDIITDDHARRYIVSSAELTDLGWRLVAMMVQT
jgi:hypothetical protein